MLSPKLHRISFFSHFAKPVENYTIIDHISCKLNLHIFQTVSKDRFDQFFFAKIGDRMNIHPIESAISVFIAVCCVHANDTCCE